MGLPEEARLWQAWLWPPQAVPRGTLSPPTGQGSEEAGPGCAFLPCLGYFTALKIVEGAELCVKREDHLVNTLESWVRIQIRPPLCGGTRIGLLPEPQFLHARQDL